MAELMGSVGGGRGGRGGRGRKKGGRKALKQDVEVTFGQGEYLHFVRAGFYTGFLVGGDVKPRMEEFFI